MVKVKYLKEKIREQIEDIIKYDNREEDLHYLENQIVGLCDTFKLISCEDAKELINLVKELKENIK